MNEKGFTIAVKSLGFDVGSNKFSLIISRDGKDVALLNKTNSLVMDTNFVGFSKLDIGEKEQLFALILKYSSAIGEVE